ncbi:ferric-chelate reductase-like protein [Amniculicola lignicola CBS 123094]|uniref:Ferric-chelate reductase-like protein n=1 Tax=Amniculicola lignicola CBS 123094 TaxID=1392246 RepID=A0A6A5VZ31_9PLEO|nr:ferric-chelate reductase-like protein [Amniculicola lignicola CBS 123094]
MLTSIYVLLLLPVVFHVAAALESGKNCFDGCELTLNYLNFNDTSQGSKKLQNCESALRTTSLYLCISVYCTPNGRTGWIGETNATCQRLGNVTLPPYNKVLAGWTQEDVAGVRRLGGDEGLTFPTLNEVVLPDGPFFLRAYRTLDAAMFEYEIHRYYGWVMHWFWAIVVVFGISTRLGALIQNIRHQEWLPISSSDRESGCDADSTPGDYTLWGFPHALLKRYITVPATFGYRCSQNVGWCTIPPRVQTLTILSFLAINVIFCCSGYRLTDGNLYWPAKSDQMWRYVSDRTGIISLMNFPLIWLFGTRNNTFIWLTGWGFGTYNNFHRWVARVATLQAVVHSVGYTAIIVQSDGWAHLSKYFHKHYFWNGELATIFMCAICAFSVYGLRRSHYEIFLVSHILFSVAALLTMYYHVEIFPDGEWNTFIWPCLLIWIFDRFLRTVRILAFSARIWNTKCEATYNPESNLIRLEIPCSQSLFAPKPGTYYYIYVLNNPIFAHQNHPFTLAYVAPEKGQVCLQPYFREDNPQPFLRRSESNKSNESESLLPSPPKSPSLVFLIRPYDGFTSRLQRMATSLVKSPRSLRVLVEGPYGETNPLHTFSSVLFIVGGTGIAVALSYLEKLLADDSRVISVHIVWAVRDHALLVEVIERDLQHFFKDERLHLTAHVTRETNPADEIPAQDMRAMKLKAGRPDVRAAVEEGAERGDAGRRSMAVVACGPAQMADDARRGCVRALEKSSRGVEYFEESFKW